MTSLLFMPSSQCTLLHGSQRPVASSRRGLVQQVCQPVKLQTLRHSGARSTAQRPKLLKLLRHFAGRLLLSTSKDLWFCSTAAAAATAIACSATVSCICGGSTRAYSSLRHVTLFVTARVCGRPPLLHLTFRILALSQTMTCVSNCTAMLELCHVSHNTSGPVTAGC